MMLASQGRAAGRFFLAKSVSLLEAADSSSWHRLRRQPPLAGRDGPRPVLACLAKCWRVSLTLLRPSSLSLTPHMG